MTQDSKNLETEELESLYTIAGCQLPQIEMDGKIYFVDGRLRQLRNVENPIDFMDFNQVHGVDEYLFDDVYKARDDVLIHLRLYEHTNQLSEEEIKQALILLLNLYWSDTCYS